MDVNKKYKCFPLGSGFQIDTRFAQNVKIWRWNIILQRIKAVNVNSGRVLSYRNTYRIISGVNASRLSPKI